MLDTKGPEIRTGLLQSGKVLLAKDQVIEITTDYTLKGDCTKIACRETLTKVLTISSHRASILDSTFLSLTAP